MPRELMVVAEYLRLIGAIRPPGGRAVPGRARRRRPSSLSSHRRLLRRAGILFALSAGGWFCQPPSDPDIAHILQEVVRILNWMEFEMTDDSPMPELSPRVRAELEAILAELEENHEEGGGDEALHS